MTPPKKNRGLIWPAIIIGLLLMQITLSLVGVYIATGDHRAAIESDDYTAHAAPHAQGSAQP